HRSELSDAGRAVNAASTRRVDRGSARNHEQEHGRDAEHEQSERQPITVRILHRHLARATSSNAGPAVKKKVQGLNILFVWSDPRGSRMQKRLGRRRELALQKVARDKAYVSRRALVLVVTLCAACAARTPRLPYASPLDDFLAAHPLSDGQNIRADEI